VKRITLIFGTRPEAIKLAPVLQALELSPLFTPQVLVTAQHRTMLDPVLEFFGIEPSDDLDLLREGQSLTEITTGALGGISEVLERSATDAVVVQGDTTTTLAGALAAYYQRVPVAHVEAGLRTGDPYEPFPEELNRRLVSQLAALHFAPTRGAAGNLLRAGIAEEHVIVTGNTVVDALLWAIEHAVPLDEPSLRGLEIDDRSVLLVTTHRRESWGERHREIAEAVAEIARTHPGVLVVFPIHRNPLVRDVILPEVKGLENVRVIEPLPYGQFVRMLQRAYVVLTDSGGVQEEAPTLRKPVLVLRPATERPEAVSHGSSKIVGTSRAEIVSEVARLLDDPKAYAAMTATRNPYGDGQASRRCVEGLASFFGLGEPPEEFS
jgi:UDP-N-acetylglucosamine 2-epimerase (non-hydrolysing)